MQQIETPATQQTFFFFHIRKSSKFVADVQMKGFRQRENIRMANQNRKRLKKISWIVFFCYKNLHSFRIVCLRLNFFWSDMYWGYQWWCVDDGLTGAQQDDWWSHLCLQIWCSSHSTIMLPLSNILKPYSVYSELCSTNRFVYLLKTTSIELFKWRKPIRILSVYDEFSHNK